MKIILFLTFCILISLPVISQESELRKNKWGVWKTDTARTHEGLINVTKKRIKLTSDNCLITEEIIFFHDACNTIVRKTKIRSDCKRHMGEGDIIYERRYKSKCGIKLR